MDPRSHRGRGRRAGARARHRGPAGDRRRPRRPQTGPGDHHCRPRRAGRYGEGGANPFARLNIDVGPDGTVYVAEALTGRVRAVTPDGAVDTLLEIEWPTGVAVGGDGTLHLATERADDESAAADVVIHQASALAVDPGGVAYLNTRDAIRRVEPDGAASVVHEPAGQVAGLAFDQHGNLYFIESTEPGQHLVRALVRPGGSQGSPVGLALLIGGGGLLLVAVLVLAVLRRRRRALAPSSS